MNFLSILVEGNTEFARFKNFKPSLSNLEKKYDKRSFMCSQKQLVRNPKHMAMKQYLRMALAFLKSPSCIYSFHKRLTGKGATKEKQLLQLLRPF